MGQCVVVGLMAQHFIWDKEVSVMKNGPVCYSGTKGPRTLNGIKKTIVGLNGHCGT